MQLDRDTPRRWEPDRLSVSTAFSLLADPHRRYTLYALIAADGELHRRDLVREVTARSSTDSAGGSDPATRERVTTALDHSHLPRLADHGVVDYDRANARVTLAPAAEELEPLLALAVDADDG